VEIQRGKSTKFDGAGVYGLAKLSRPRGCDPDSIKLRDKQIKEKGTKMPVAFDLDHIIICVIFMKIIKNVAANVVPCLTVPKFAEIPPNEVHGAVFG